MFTSIAKLRASSAMQSRVNTVENWLKRQNASWTPELKFPIFLIASSNAVDDVEWVAGSAGTHIDIPGLHKAVLDQFGHKSKGEHLGAIGDLLRAGVKAKAIEEIKAKYAAAFIAANVNEPMLAALLGAPVLGTAAPVAATPAVETATPVAQPAAITSVDVVNGSVPHELPGQTAQAAAETPIDFAVYGGAFIALGAVIAEKQKTFTEAVAYSLTPTGSRFFGEHVTANGVDATAARKFLKEFAATLPQ